jgi:hypothetical protein
MRNLTFAEQQLLDAAQEGLRNWREPNIREKTMKLDDEPKNEEANAVNQKQEQPPVPVTKKRKEKLKVAKRAKGRGGKKRKAASANGSGKRAGRAPRIADEAKITKTSKDNPFREGSGSYKRVEAVWKNSGQTAGTIKKKVDLKPGSLSNMVKLGLINAS